MGTGSQVATFDLNSGNLKPSKTYKLKLSINF
jgi:hypothetical protein